MSAAAFDNSQP